MNWPATEEHIRTIYRSLLDREPDEVGLRAFQEIGDVATIIDIVKNSVEARSLRNSADASVRSPFYHYNTSIDIEGIVRRYARRDATPVPGRLVNYLGVVIDPDYLPSVLSDRGGTVEDAPIPANWHADMAEFGATLRAVDLAHETFRVLELGCGWGCWLLNTGVAARSVGLSVELMGAEGDAGHVAFAKRACFENGFDETQALIVRRIVGPRHGSALFPKQEKSGEQWGLQAVFDATEEQVRDAGRTGNFDVLPVVTLDDFVRPNAPIDLLHLDVQGVEADFIDSCIDAMNRAVCYLVVGTHSRQIEGRIFDRMLTHGWVLEIERPALLSVYGREPYVTVDGVQGWRNPRLRP